MAEGIGSWANFDEMEDQLVLDELLLLHECLAKSKHENMRIMAAIQGVDIGGEEETFGPSSSSDEELPPELLAAERAWQEKKRKAQEDGTAAESELTKLGIGYSRS